MNLGKIPAAWRKYSLNQPEIQICKVTWTKQKQLGRGFCLFNASIYCNCFSFWVFTQGLDKNKHMKMVHDIFRRGRNIINQFHCLRFCPRWWFGGGKYCFEILKKISLATQKKASYAWKNEHFCYHVIYETLLTSILVHWCSAWTVDFLMENVCIYNINWSFLGKNQL